MRNNITYTESQKNAIIHKEGPAAVFAGPGSGKTFVITEHILYLIYTLRVLPQHILVITFTKAAARQMEKRFFHKSTMQEPVLFKTFHAFFYQILSLNLSTSNKKIISSNEKKEIIKMIAMELFPSALITADLIEQISLCITKRKEGLERDRNETKFSKIEVDRIIQIYEEEKEKINRLDFIDLVFLCYEVLKHDPKLRNSIRKQFSYILIDEFQDITPIQYKIVKLMVGISKNIFIVGDEDQSIYQFCGSNSDCMQHFLLDFPSTKQYFLKENFRSCCEIIRRSQLLIENNHNRVKKTIISNKKEEGNFKVVGFISKDLEHQYIIDKIKQWGEKEKSKNKMGTMKTIAIISRTKENMKRIYFKLLARNIRIENKSATSSFFENARVKDVLAYIDFAKNGCFRKDLFRILNKPVRYIRNNAFRKEKVLFNDAILYYEENEQMKDTIRKLAMQMCLIETMSIAGAIHFIRKGIGYDIYLQKIAKKKNGDYSSWISELDLLEEIARTFTSYDQFISYLKTDQINLIEMDGENFSYNKFLKIEIITMHAAKGLEFDKVFILDVNEGNIPHKKAKGQEAIEEERRLFYVSITRAREEVQVLYLNSEKNNRHKKSRYIDECMKEI